MKVKWNKNFYENKFGNYRFHYHLLHVAVGSQIFEKASSAFLGRFGVYNTHGRKRVKKKFLFIRKRIDVDRSKQNENAGVVLIFSLWVFK